MGKCIRSASLVALAVPAAVLLCHAIAFGQHYRDIIKDARIVEVRGETADTTKLGNDRYVEDNIDYLLPVRPSWSACSHGATVDTRSVASRITCCADEFGATVTMSFGRT